MTSAAIGIEHDRREEHAGEAERQAEARQHARTDPPFRGGHDRRRGDASPRASLRPDAAAENMRS